MRAAVLIAALLLAGCQREPSFDERYAKAAQSLLDGTFRCRRDVLAGELRQTLGQALGFRVLYAQSHSRFFGS